MEGDAWWAISFHNLPEYINKIHKTQVKPSVTSKWSHALTPSANRNGTRMGGPLPGRAHMCARVREDENKHGEVDLVQGYPRGMADCLNPHTNLGRRKPRGLGRRWWLLIRDTGPTLAQCWASFYKLAQHWSSAGLLPRVFWPACLADSIQTFTYLGNSRPSDVTLSPSTGVEECVGAVLRLSAPVPVFSYKLRYIVGFGLVVMA